MEKTALEIQREKEYEKHKGEYEFIVVNTNEDYPQLKTFFTNIEQVLHKVKLDILTNVNLGLSNAEITVKLRKIQK